MLDMNAKLFLTLLFFLACALALWSENIASANGSCSRVIAQQQPQQCSFVKEHCRNLAHGHLDYYTLYYCTLKSLGGAAILPLFAVLALLFCILATLALDYLCPNLYTVSKFLGLSDNLAGLTIMALGNSSPDVLSTYRAMHVGSGALAASELAGAALFVTSAVVGSIAIAHPFKVPRYLFVRDVSFLAAVVCLLLFVSLHASLLLPICLAFVIAYVSYVLIVLFRHTWLKRRHRQQIAEYRTRAAYHDDPDHVYPVSDEDLGDRFANLPTIADLENPSELSLSRAISPVFSKTNDGGGEEPTLEVSLGDMPRAAAMPDPTGLMPLEPHDAEVRSSSRSSFMSALTAEEEDVELEETVDEADPLLPYKVRHVVKAFGDSKSTLVRLFTPGMANVNQKQSHSRIYHYIFVILSSFFRVFTPLRDESTLVACSAGVLPFDRDAASLAFDYALDKTLVTIQTFCGINFLGFALLSGSRAYWYAWLPLTGMASSAAALIIHKLYDSHSVRLLKRINYSLAFLGFVVLVSWILIIATEIVELLKAFAVILHLSEDVLGVTVFAWGNSIGDFVSNMAIARMGLPVMAFGACFGGPLLSICALGLSGLLIIPLLGDELTFPLQPLASLVITCCALILNAGCLLFLVPRNQWYLDRHIGMCLLGIWLTTNVLCIILELV